MTKILKALLSPAKLIIAAALVVAVGAGTGHILPRANAADCESEQCSQIVDQTDEPTDPTCLIKDGEFFTPVPIPKGQHANSDGFCVDDPTTPQVLGESTTVDDVTPPAPQVLAASTFTGK